MLTSDYLLTMPSDGLEPRQVRVGEESHDIQTCRRPREE